MNIFPIQKLSIKIIFLSLLPLFLGASCTPVKPVSQDNQENQNPLVLEKNEAAQQPQKESGLSPSLSLKQIFEPLIIPSKQSVSQLVLQKADERFHAIVNEIPRKGITRNVPSQFTSIQAALDASLAGDSIVVEPGIYYELLQIKEGIRLVSATSDQETMVTVEGAFLKLPKRTLETVIDGSKSTPSNRGMLDFAVGSDIDTIVDGFTIQNLPVQNHHIAGHAHAINLRGSSPIIMNCLVQNNGSTGIGSHVIYHDQKNAIEERDFRKANILSKASGILYRNIVRNNLGRGIGCNHFSSPIILGNEVYDNDDSSLGDSPGPGIGIQHGASPVVIGNIVHSNPGGGILIKAGDSQGTYPIDHNPTAKVQSNLIFANGFNRPALSCQKGGSAQNPVEFSDNYIFDFGGIGIGLGKHSFGSITNNFLANGQFTGVAVNGSTALQVTDNVVANMGNSAFTFVNKALIKELENNRVFGIRNTPFIIQGSTIEEKE